MMSSTTLGPPAWCQLIQSPFLDAVCCTRGTLLSPVAVTVSKPWKRALWSCNSLNLPESVSCMSFCPLLGGKVSIGKKWLPNMKKPVVKPQPLYLSLQSLPCPECAPGLTKGHKKQPSDARLPTASYFAVEGFTCVRSKGNSSPPNSGTCFPLTKNG